jgi:hypothetical protein
MVKPRHEDSDRLDLVWGAEAIAKELNVTVRRAFYLLERGELPKKVGGRWVAARRRLRSLFFDDQR